jgi:hypothetical protein
MRIPVRIEASQAGGKRYLELDDPSAALLEEYLETIDYRMERV